MKLVAGSDLIDQGEDVGFSFYGTAPDLGCFESNYIPTPVSLVSFTAKAENDKVVLNWNTLNQFNNKGWQIERATITNSTKNDWQVVGSVTCSTSISVASFSFIDAKLTPGEYLYRLKQLDNDGTYSYSNTQKVIVGGSTSLNYAIYPMPATSQSIVSYYLANASNVQLLMYNTDGKLLGTLLSTKQLMGEHKFQLGSNLPKTKGMYIIQLRTESTVINKLVSIP